MLTNKPMNFGQAPKKLRIKIKSIKKLKKNTMH